MRLTNQSPSVDNLLKQGRNCIREQKLNEAVTLSQQVNKLYPNHGDGWYFTAQVALTLGNAGVARQSLKNACKLVPKHIPWQIALADVYFRNHDFSAAQAVVQSIARQTLTALEHNQLGLLCAQMQMSDEAIQHYHQAIELDPENHEHYYSLATVLRHAGNLKQAEIHLNNALAREPLDVDAQTLIVDLKKQTAEHNHIAALKRLLNQSISPKQAVQIYFALAKSYEDMAQYSESFEHLQQGAKLRRQHIDYAVQQDIATMADISQCFAEEWWRNKTFPGALEHSSTQQTALTPIFILGLPRTGSTLTEQILSAPENVYAGGELYDFSRLLSEQVSAKFGASIKTKKDFVLASSQIDFTRLGQDYLDSVSARMTNLTTEYGYFTDKLPFNFLSIGLIKKALPDAKIIHVTRDPMDTGYAIFKTLFQQVYPYSYDQIELAQYYIAYQKLMSHWQQLFGASIYTLRYEDLVAEPDKISQHLYQFCGMSWRPEYAQVQHNKSAVTTASASQVRQVIHQGSVQKWRKFENQLQPFKMALMQAGIHCD